MQATLHKKSGGMHHIKKSGGMKLINKSGGMAVTKKSGGMHHMKKSGGMNLTKKIGGKCGMPLETSGGMQHVKKSGGMHHKTVKGGMYHSKKHGGSRKLIKGGAQIEVDGKFYEITTTEDSVTVKAMEPESFEATKVPVLDKDGFPVPPPPGTSTNKDFIAPTPQDLEEAMQKLKEPTPVNKNEGPSLEQLLQTQKEKLNPVKKNIDTIDPNAQEITDEKIIDDSLDTRDPIVQNPTSTKSSDKEGEGEEEGDEEGEALNKMFEEKPVFGKEKDTIADLEKLSTDEINVEALSLALPSGINNFDELQGYITRLRASKKSEVERLAKDDDFIQELIKKYPNLEDAITKEYVPSEETNGGKHHKNKGGKHHKNKGGKSMKKGGKHPKKHGGSLKKKGGKK